MLQKYFPNEWINESINYIPWRPCRATNNTGPQIDSHTQGWRLESQPLLVTSSTTSQPLPPLNPNLWCTLLPGLPLEALRPPAALRGLWMGKCQQSRCNSQDTILMQMSSVIKQVEIEKHKIDDIGAKLCLNRPELKFSIRCQWVFNMQMSCFPLGSLKDPVSREIWLWLKNTFHY